MYKVEMPGKKPAQKRSIVAKLIAAFAIPCLLSIVVPARGRKDSPQDRKYDMGTFYLCLMVKGPKFDPTAKPENASWGPGHLKHVIGLIESGRAVIAGPLADDDRIRGILVLTSGSEDEARSLVEADPSVKAGQHSVEVLKWFAAKNVMKKPDAPLSLTTYYFGLLKAGPNPVPSKTPEAAALQAAHMKNIQAMAASGKLVIAGPLINAKPYAGVFVFKVDSLEEAKALAEADPAVKAGDLVVEVHPWSVPRGSLP